VGEARVSRWWLALAVMLAWFAALGWLVARERAAGGEARELAANARRVGPASASYAVEIAGRRVGFATTTVDTLADGIRAALRYDVTLPAGDGGTRVLVAEETYMSRDLALRSFSAALRSGEGGPLMSSGEVRYGLLDWSVAAAHADTATARFALARGAVPRTGIPLRVAFSGRMETGVRFELTVVDPLGARPAPATIHVGRDSLFLVADSATLDPATRRWSAAHADTVRAWQVETAGSAPASLWVDAQGQMVEATTAEGFVLRRAPFEVVTAPPERSDSGEAAWPVPPAGRLDHEPGALDRLTVVLAPGADRWRDPLDGGAQQLRGDTLAVGRPGGSLAPAYRLPNADTALAAELAPDALVPSRDPAVVTQAERIVAGERRPQVAASLLAAWLARSVARDPHGTADARLALAFRRGDVTAHAELFVAFARAIGLPARLAGGAVYDHGRWWYHTWTEVWLDGWVAADPWFGTMPAPASYVRLVAGVPGRPFQVIPLLQRLAPRVLSSTEHR
jgi:transglutaminase-like putative cysteine protease